MTTVDENLQIDHTPITWDMVEHDFQKKFTIAKTGLKRNAKTIGDGNGFVSRIVLAEFDWTEDSDPSLPKVAVLKITTMQKLRELATVMSTEVLAATKMAKAVNDTEFLLYTYAEENPEFGSQMKVAKMYVGREFDDAIEAGYFAIEYFENFAHRHFYHTVQESAVHEILSILAKLGSFSLRNPDAARRLETPVFTEMLNEFVNRKKLEASLNKVVERQPERAAQIDVLRHMLFAYESVDAYLKLMEPFDRVKMLCHGDMWPGNMIWEKSDNGDYHVKNLIDWQIMHRGTPLEDLFRILTSAVAVPVYKAKRDDFIKFYYRELKKELDGWAGELPWSSEEEIIEAYERFFPILGIAFLPMFAELEEMLFRTCNESEKEECLKCFHDKMFNTFEEAAKYTEKYYLKKA